MSEVRVAEVTSGMELERAGVFKYLYLSDRFGVIYRMVIMVISIKNELHATQHEAHNLPH